MLNKIGLFSSVCAGLLAAYSPTLAAEEQSEVDTVIVTGTRVTGVKAEDSAAPIQVVGVDALKRVGQPDLIQSLAQNLPSFNTESIGGDLGNLTLAAALRGLNPNNTLVLVNGKRRHATANLHVLPGSFQGAATADLGLIPVAAIERIEVLQDGAAAQYGSDAIAGVINIILKKNSEGGVISATAGEYFKGDGPTAAISMNMGLPVGEAGFASLTFENRYHGHSQRGGIDRRVQNEDGTLRSDISAIDAAGLAGADGFPYINKINGDSASNIYNVFLNAGYDLGFADFYTALSYSHRKASAFQNFRLPSRVTRTVGADTIVPFPNGFAPKEATKEDDYSLLGGFKGTAAGWDWDASLVYGRDQHEISTINSANASLFSDTGFTPRDFFDGTFVSTDRLFNVDVRRDIEIGWSTPLSLALGFEDRNTTYEIKPGDAASIYKEGGQSFPGFQPSDAGKHERASKAVYIDLAGQPIEGLTVDVAGRIEDFDDFGQSTVGKLTARYDFNDMFAIRGTISTGFRAPTLPEAFYSATNVAPTFAVVQLPANSSSAALVGFKPLTPEESDNLSIGLVMHPLPRLQITIDAYEIKIKDRIIATGTLLGLDGTTVVSQDVLDAIADHGNVLDPNVSYVGISVFTNGADTKTRGVDITANYSTDFGDMGKIDWSAGINFTDTEVTKQNELPAQAFNADYQTKLLSRNALGLITTATPKQKVVLGAVYTNAKWSIGLREIFYGEVSLWESTSGSGEGANAVLTKIKPTGITDLDINYELTEAIKISIGANNLFDKEAPKMPNVSNGLGGVRPANGGNVYGAPLGITPWGINGGYYYGRVTYTF